MRIYACRFLGAIARKQLFVQIYAYFTYIHFFVNVVVAAYLLYVVTHFSDNALEHACQGTVQNPQGQEQCGGLLKFARGVYVAVAGIVLLIEMCELCRQYDCQTDRLSSV